MSWGQGGGVGTGDSGEVGGYENVEEGNSIIRKRSLFRLA